MEGGRREEKGFSFLCLLFHTFFFFLHFPRIHQAPLDTCLTGVALISPEGGFPFSPLHAAAFPVNLHFKTGNEPIKDGH